MNHLSAARVRTSAVVRRIGTAVIATFAVVVLASTRAAALVPPPDDPSSGGAAVPAPPTVSSSTNPLLWIGLAVVALALFAVIAAVRARRRSPAGQTSGAPAAA